MSGSIMLSPVYFDPVENWYKRGCRIAWYDRRARVWTSYLVDDAGNQRTPADHYANKSQFAICERRGDFHDDAEVLAEAIANGDWG